MYQFIDLLMNRVETY